MYISILRSTIRTRHSVFAIVSVLATPGVRRGGASVGVGVGVVGGDTVGYGGIRWDGIRWHWQEEDGSMGGVAM